MRPRIFSLPNKRWRRRCFSKQRVVGTTACVHALTHQSLMPWVWLTIAGLLEIVWATGLKYTEGFSKFWPSVVTILLMLASFWCLSQAMRTLPLGTSYAVWTGIGAVGTAIVGMLLFKEPATVARSLCILLIVAGIVGLKLTAKA